MTHGLQAFPNFVIQEEQNNEILHQVFRLGMFYAMPLKIFFTKTIYITL